MPAPDPALVTVRLLPSIIICVNVAATDLVASIITVQVPVPGQAGSDQPENTDPTIGVAVNVTDVLVAYEAEQVAPQ